MMGQGFFGGAAATAAGQNGMTGAPGMWAGRQIGQGRFAGWTGQGAAGQGVAGGGQMQGRAWPAATAQGNWQIAPAPGIFSRALSNPNGPDGHQQGHGTIVPAPAVTPVEAKDPREPEGGWVNWRAASETKKT